MMRQVIKIDQEKCIGCEQCVNACQEGAIAMVDGKAKLVREDHCDGLGNCLPECPTGAISFEMRDVPAFNKKDENKDDGPKHVEPLACGCPGTMSKSLPTRRAEAPPAAQNTNFEPPLSQLQQWPVQIKLVPINAPYFDNANLLVAADCAAFAHGNFHNEFMKNKITIIGCPKLDSGDYAEKLTAIIKENNIKSVTVARMEVPCCGGLEHAVKRALMDSGKMIPWQIVTISTEGDILEN